MNSTLTFSNYDLTISSVRMEPTEDSVVVKIYKDRSGDKVGDKLEEVGKLYRFNATTSAGKSTTLSVTALPLATAKAAYTEDDEYHYLTYENLTGPIYVIIGG